MERRRFGKTGMEVGVLGFGGSEIGFGPATQDEASQILNEALDAGLNVIDTAECYMDSEEKIGNAVSHRREDFFLFSKTGHSSGFEQQDWDPGMMAKQIDRSLQRLKTDHLDLWQLHSPELEDLKQGQIIEALQRAKEAGKTRFIGCSGDNETSRYAVECGAFDALQTSYNIADLDAESVIAGAHAKGMGVIAKRPIANAAWARCEDPNKYGHAYWLRFRELKYPFLDGPLDESIGKALRFVLSNSGVCTAIAGTRTRGRFQENLKTLNRTKLSPQEVEAIRWRWMEVKRDDWTGQG